MTQKRKEIIKYVLSAALAVGLLYFCFRKVDWADFFSCLKSCNWSFVILSMLFGVLAFFLRAVRWKQLLQPIDCETSLLTTFNGINISYVANLVFPRLGEFVRCGVVTAHSKVDYEADGEKKKLASYDKVLGTVVLERIWDLVMMLLVLVVFLAFTWNKFGNFFMSKIAGNISPVKILLIALVAIAGIVALIFFVVHFKGKNNIVGKVSSFFQGIGKGFASCLKMKKLGWFFAVTLGIWVCYWMMSLMILLAFKGVPSGAVSLTTEATLAQLQSLNAIDALFLMLAGSLASVVPVPGGFGAFHYVVGLAISSVYGIPFEFGILFATLSHESQTINQLICGGCSYLSETFRKK